MCWTVEQFIQASNKKVEDEETIDPNVCVLNYFLIDVESNEVLSLCVAIFQTS